MKRLNCIVNALIASIVLLASPATAQTGTLVSIDSGEGGAGDAIVLDIADDGADESAGITEIATSAANAIFIVSRVLGKI